MPNAGPTPMPGHSLYEQLLGDSFAELHPPLGAFHRATCARGSGEFSVVRPGGGWRRWLAQRMALPPAGDAIPLELEVQATDTGKVWRRWFGNHEMVTRQRLWRGLLVESSGPVQLGMEVCVRHGGMTMRTVRAWLTGIPLPRLLAPRVTAVVLPTADGWRVRIRIGLPLIGEVTRYEGEVVVHECRTEPAASAGSSGSV